MPHFRIVKEEGKESQLTVLDTNTRTKTDEERRAEALRQNEFLRQKERDYSRLVASPRPGEARYGPPNPQEGEVITEETRKRLEQERQQKAAVGNVVTTHSDLAKVAKGSDVGIVRTVDVYTKDDPMEDSDAVLPTEDRTVTLHGTRIGGSVADRADMTIPQPQGDEYSAKSATGPTLPEGKVLDTEGEVEKAHDVEDSPSDIDEASADAAVKAREAAAANVEKTEPKPAAKSKSASKAAPKSSKGGKK